VQSVHDTVAKVFGRSAHLAAISDDQWRITVEALHAQNKPDALWQILFIAPLQWALYIMPRLSEMAFTPEPRDARLWTKLTDLYFGGGIQDAPGRCYVVEAFDNPVCIRKIVSPNNSPFAPLYFSADGGLMICSAGAAWDTVSGKCLGMIGQFVSEGGNGAALVTVRNNHCEVHDCADVRAGAGSDSMSGVLMPRDRGTALGSVSFFRRAPAAGHANDPLPGYSKRKACIVSPDRSLIAFVDEAREIIIAELASRKPVCKLEAESEPTTMTITADNARLVTWDQAHLMTVWDIGRARKAGSTRRPASTEEQCRSIAVAPTGRQHLVLRGMGGSRTLELRDLCTGTVLRPLERNVEGAAAVFSADGKMFAARIRKGGFDSTEIWNVGTAAKAGHCSGEPLAFSPDGQMLSTSEGSWKITDLSKRYSFFFRIMSPDGLLIGMGDGDDEDYFLSGRTAEIVRTGPVGLMTWADFERGKERIKQLPASLSKICAGHWMWQILLALLHPRFGDHIEISDESVVHIAQSDIAIIEQQTDSKAKKPAKPRG